MRNIRRTFKGPSVLLKTHRSRAVLFRTRFTTICRSEIHIRLKVDTDALNRLWRRFLVRCTIHNVSRTVKTLC